MAERIERKEFVRRLAERMQADDATAAAWLDGMVEEMYQTFRSGSGLTLPGLGGFYLDRRRDGWIFKFNPAQRLRALFGWSSSYRARPSHGRKMIVLRCTQRLLKASGIKPVEEPPAPTAPLGEWYANIVSLPFRGRSLVVFVHDRTLLSVVAPGRVLGTTVPTFQQRLPCLLQRLDLPQAWIDEHKAALSEVCFTRTASRSVLGTMNDIARQIWGDAGSVRSFDQLDLDWLEARLGEVPYSALRYRSPIGALAELVQGTPAR